VTTADINGHDVGKILLVVGSGHKEWQQNLAVATALNDNLQRIAPGISRGLKERKNLTYNQDLHPGALSGGSGGA
jgi:stage II sporulation protein P